MQGASDGLPTWALIVIIVGSVVVGILLISILWCCWRKNRRTSPVRMNGTVTPYNNYGVPNTVAYTQQFNPQYTYGATYPIAGARPFAGALPNDPVQAQAQELNKYRREADDDDEMKIAIEESKKLSQGGGSSNEEVDDIDLAIALSLSEEQKRGNEWRYPGVL
jgi:hypothetical protein